MRKILFAVCCLFFINFTSFSQDSSNTMMDSSLTDFIGTYFFPDGSPVNEVKIEWQDASLIINSDQGTATVAKLGVDSFSMDYNDGILLFKRDEENKVNKIIIIVMGMTLEGTKQPAIPDGTSLSTEKNFDIRRVLVAYSK